MEVLSKHIKEILAAVGIIIAYLITRTILLSDLPIFTDEAIYVRWMQVAVSDASWRFISLTDGKQPLFIWFGMVSSKFFDDPLVALRMVSVFSGLFTLFGLFMVTYELFKNRFISFLASFIYILYPFAIVYDRLAIYDSLVSAIAIWSFYFSVMLVKKANLGRAYTLGFFLGAGVLTKSSAIFSVYLLPFTLLLFDFKQKNWKKNLVWWLIFAGFAALLSQIFYNVLRFSPFFHIITEKNAIFVYPVSDWIEHPFTFFFGNLKGLVNWLFVYLTPFYLALIFLSFTSFKFIKEKLLLFIYFLLPFIALALFGKVIFPRFIFFMSIYLIPLIAIGLFYVIEYTDGFFKKRNLEVKNIIIVLSILLFSIYPGKVVFDYIFNTVNSEIAEPDKDQYVVDWPSGGGIKEATEFFREEADKGKIFIATEGTFGLLPYSFEIYLGQNRNVEIKGYWPIESTIPEEVINKSLEIPTYFVFYQPCMPCSDVYKAPESWGLELVKEFKKGHGEYSLVIYRVN